MILKTFSLNGCGQIVLDDDASSKDIYKAMYIDATEPNSNGKEKGRVPNDKTRISSK